LQQFELQCAQLNAHMCIQSSSPVCFASSTPMAVQGTSLHEIVLSLPLASRTVHVLQSTEPQQLWQVSLHKDYQSCPCRIGDVIEARGVRSLADTRLLLLDATVSVVVPCAAGAENYSLLDLLVASFCPEVPNVGRFKELLLLQLLVRNPAQGLRHACFSICLLGKVEHAPVARCLEDLARILPISCAVSISDGHEESWAAISSPASYLSRLLPDLAFEIARYRSYAAEPGLRKLLPHWQMSPWMAREDRNAHPRALVPAVEDSLRALQDAENLMRALHLSPRHKLQQLLQQSDLVLPLFVHSSEAAATAAVPLPCPVPASLAAVVEAIALSGTRTPLAVTPQAGAVMSEFLKRLEKQPELALSCVPAKRFRAFQFFSQTHVR
jgi:hypothetical protein